MTAELVVDTPSAVNPAYNTTLGVIRAAQPRAKSLHYLICAFSGNFTDHSTEAVQISIGAADFPGGAPFWDLADLGAVTATERVFNSTTSVHDVLRADLQALGGYVDARAVWVRCFRRKSNADPPPRPHPLLGVAHQNKT